jgi:hypothetical protein
MPVQSTCRYVYVNYSTVLDKSVESMCSHMTVLLQILHVCYDLVSILHTHATDPSKTMPQLRFWTEQLKQAHLVRYGGLGGNVEHVRRIMKHTRAVLRSPSGMDATPHAFL